MLVSFIGLSMFISSASPTDCSLLFLNSLILNNTFRPPRLNSAAVTLLFLSQVFSQPPSCKFWGKFCRTFPCKLQQCAVGPASIGILNAGVSTPCNNTLGFCVSHAAKCSVPTWTLDFCSYRDRFGNQIYLKGGWMFFRWWRRRKNNWYKLMLACQAFYGSDPLA